MHFPVIGECLGWRTTDFEELYGDLGQWSMTKELAREVSGFYLSSPCEVWWIAVLNMSRSRADGTMSSWLLYFRNFTNFHTVSYIIWTPLWTRFASAAAILSNISADVQYQMFIKIWIFVIIVVVNNFLLSLAAKCNIGDNYHKIKWKLIWLWCFCGNDLGKMVFAINAKFTVTFSFVD